MYFYIKKKIIIAVNKKYSYQYTYYIHHFLRLVLSNNTSYCKF